MNNWLNKIAITKIPKVGPVTARQLISYCGSLDAVFNENKKALAKIPGVGEKLAADILSRTYFKKAEKELRFIEKQEIQPLFFLDSNYPYRLKSLYDAPLLLYYKGSTDLNKPRSVAVIGTRKPTPMGAAICEELVEGLKAYNVVIISGLAYGIDVIAHKKCLDLEIETIGVLGHGLGQVYPAAHKSVARRMLVKGGLLTEFSSDRGPDPGHFPMRNRIVAGMCDALIVVETARKGGSMITARFANEYSKDVFAVPGRIKDSHLKGCNHLIKSHQAALIESAADVGYIMRWEEAELFDKKELLYASLNNREMQLVKLLEQSENITIDELTIGLNYSSSEVASILLNLEFKGLVKSLPGKRFLLIH